MKWQTHTVQVQCGRNKTCKRGGWDVVGWQRARARLSVGLAVESWVVRVRGPGRAAAMQQHAGPPARAAERAGCLALLYSGWAAQLSRIMHSLSGSVPHRSSRFFWCSVMGGGAQRAEQRQQGAGSSAG